MGSLLENGYEKVNPDMDDDADDAVDPCVPTQTLERVALVAPFDPKPNKGGFIPNNNVYQRQ